MGLAPESRVRALQDFVDHSDVGVMQRLHGARRLPDIEQFFVCHAPPGVDHALETQIGSFGKQRQQEQWLQVHSYAYVFGLEMLEESREIREAVRFGKDLQEL